MKEAKTIQNIFYEVTKTFLKNEDEHTYEAYGICAFCHNGDKKVILDEIKDVSTNFEFVKELVDRFNKFDLHIEHFREVIFDSIYAQTYIS